MTSPFWSTEEFAGSLPDISSDALRTGAQIYRDSAGEFSRSIGPILYALAEALDYIAFLKDKANISEAEGEL